MRKKKILFLHVCLGRGGAERLRYILLKNIDKNKYDIKICCIGHKGEIGEQIEKLGYPVDVLGLKYTFKDIGTTLKIAGYLRREKPDILQTSLFDANFHGRVASLGSGIRYIITEEHSDHYQYKSIKYLPYIVSDFVLSACTKYIVSCSETLRRDIIKKEKLPKHKVVTIKNCIDPSMYDVKENKTAIKNRFSIRDEVVFMTTASLSNRKGHIYLIDAFSEIKKKRKDFKCFFAGDGPLRDELYKKCHESDLSHNVIFLGNVENIADYLNASDIFILPSLFEGLPIALIEAMYMGLPCIVTDVGANRELITHGQNGIVVEPGSKQELENAILSCLENKDKLSGFGIINRKIAKQSCMVEGYAAQFYKLWDGLN